MKREVDQRLKKTIIERKNLPLNSESSISEKEFPAKRRKTSDTMAKKRELRPMKGKKGKK